MDLYDDLDVWYCDGDELLGANSGKTLDHNEDISSSTEKPLEIEAVRIQVRIALSCDAVT